MKEKRELRQKGMTLTHQINSHIFTLFCIYRHADERVAQKQETAKKLQQINS